MTRVSEQIWSFPVVKKLLAPFHPLQPNICMHSLHTVLLVGDDFHYLFIIYLFYLLNKLNKLFII